MTFIPGNLLKNLLWDEVAIWRRNISLATAMQDQSWFITHNGSCGIQRTYAAPILCFAAMLILVQSVNAQALNQQFSLNTDGASSLYWPFTNNSSLLTAGNETNAGSATGTNGWVRTQLHTVTGPPDHNGCDWWAEDWARSHDSGTTEGEDFVSPISGKVIFAGDSGLPAYGKQVVIQSSVKEAFAFRVAHLQVIYVAKNDQIDVGAPLGKVGHTGVDTPPEHPPDYYAHTHCALYKNLTPAQLGILSTGHEGPDFEGNTSVFAAEFHFNAAASGNIKAKNTGVLVPGATCSASDGINFRTDNQGHFFYDPWLFGAKRTITAVQGYLRATVDLILPPEVNGSVLPANTNQNEPTIELSSVRTVPNGDASAGFSMGDVVEVFGTGVGLRARYPDPSSQSWIVMPDGATGTVVGGPVWSSGYFRWQIRYDSVPGVNTWSAEGEPETGEFFLREATTLPIPAAPTNLTASAVSSSQINLAWSDRSANETGFMVERAVSSGGPWTLRATTWANATAYSDPGLIAGTTYYYRVKATTSGLASDPSNLASAISQSPVSSTHTLAVNSVNPASAVYIYISPGDQQNHVDGITPIFGRIYNHLAVVRLIAPSSMNGKPFVKWQRDGVDFQVSMDASITMDADHTMTAIYGSVTGTRTLTSFDIVGPATVNERTSVQYTGVAYFSDGSSSTVQPIWNSPISSSGILDAGAVSSDTVLSFNASFTLDGISRTNIKTVTIKNVDTPQTYTLTLSVNNSAQGSITASPFSNGTYAAGSTVRVTASANAGAHFTGWGGAASGTASYYDVVMNANKTVTASFGDGDSRQGTLVVTIQPPAAAAAGVKWGLSTDDLLPSGASLPLSPETLFLVLNQVDGWLPPNAFQIGSVPAFGPVTITAGQTTNVTINMTQDTTPGTLNVTLTPPGPVGAGAKWHVNGGAAQNSGASVSLSPSSSYSISFDGAAGWTAPSSQTAVVTRGQSTFITASYTPASGQPAISAVHPSFGALAGGTLLTIEGVNLTGTSSVSIGGKPATNITVVSPTQITCNTPSSTVYGTAAVVVQTVAGSATSANGFSYGVARGSGMTLVSAVGGRVNGVAVQGNYAYIGEGSSFVVEDITNPTSPSPVGRLAMPGMVQDIAMSGQYAFVANDDSGLQVVDVSTPTAPKLIGFYSTSGIAQGVAVLGSNVYLADGNSGLMIFDITTPTKPTLTSSTNLGNFTWDVAVNQSGSNFFAYCMVNGSLVVVDATTPAAPQVRGSLGMGSSSAQSLAVAGNRVFVAAFSAGLKMIDVSNPNSPVDLPRDGAAPFINPLSVTVANNVVYAAGNAGFFTFTFSSGTLTLAGQTNNFASSGVNLAVSSNRAYIAGGASGFAIANVTSSSSPALLGSATSLSGDYGSVALSGNYTYACVGGGFKIFSITNPALPTLAGQYTETSGGASQVLAANGVAYYIGSALDIVNVSNPASPTLTTTIPLATISTRRMALAGNNLVAVGWDTSGKPKLITVDVSNPSSPVVRGTLNFTTISSYTDMSLSVVGSKAVVGFSTGQFKVVDVSNVNSPAERGTLSNIGNPSDITFSSDGHYVFVSDSSGNTFRVTDVSDPANPTQIASVSLASVPTAIALKGTFVYVIGASNVWQFDVSAPASPVLTRSYSAPNRGTTSLYGITVATNAVDQSDYVYAGDFRAGLIVLQTTDNSAPSLVITSPTSSPTYTATTGSLSVSGTASDNQNVTLVTWSNDRGGGGNATGTSAWSAGGITLAPGTNVVTVTAFDPSGNAATKTLTVTYSPPDSTAPTVSITLARQGGMVTTSSSTIDLQGAAADNIGVAGVQWSSDRGGSGSASGSATWTAAAIPLQLGPNNITLTASDAAGNTGTASITATYTPLDVTPPTTTIQFPTLLPVFSTNVGTLNLSGIAADDRGVASVSWSNDQGGSGVATGTDLWSINGIALQVGLNVITMTSQDAVGNMQSDSLAVTYTPQPVPQITSPASATAIQGQYFVYLVTATSTPGSFDVSGLPAGLSLDSSMGLISGIPIVVGSSAVTLSASNSGGTGQAPLTLSVSPPFTASQNWRQQHFGTIDNSGSGADLASATHDGIPNLIKYALVLDPSLSLGAALAPAHVRNDVDGDRIALTFNRDPMRNDINIYVEATDDLSTWTVVGSSIGGASMTGAGVVGESDVGGGLKSVEVRDTVNRQQAPHRFMRVRVSR